jgi:hypothetical protein
MSRFDVLHMIKRRAEAADLPYSTLLPYLWGYRNYDLSAKRGHAGACPDHRQLRIPRTTKLYDRTREELSFEEVARINI